MLKRFDPMGGGFLRLGRRDADETACALWWSGSGIATRIDCTRLEIEAETGNGGQTPWIAVTVDGALVARLPMMAGSHRYALLEGMERGFPHEVAVTRDSQPTDSDAAPLRLVAVLTDGEPVAPAPRPRLIEFIGDSLTVGEGCVGPTAAMEWRTAWMSNALAYPERVCRALNAEKRVIALGGWGVYRSWDNDPACAIGRIYDRLCAVVPGGDVAFDFSRQRAPDAVVINLGTNDASALDGMDAAERAVATEQVARSAAALIQKVRAHAPGAAILWAYGMCGDALADSLQRAVMQARAGGDANAAYLSLDGCGDEPGSRAHPAPAVHRRAAKKIAAALEGMLRQA